MVREVLLQQKLKDKSNLYRANPKNLHLVSGHTGEEAITVLSKKQTELSSLGNRVRGQIKPFKQKKQRQRDGEKCSNCYRVDERKRRTGQHNRKKVEWGMRELRRGLQEELDSINMLIVCSPFNKKTPPTSASEVDHRTALILS